MNNLFEDPEISSPTLLERQGVVRYYPDFIARPQAWFEQLEKEIQWRQDHITLYGKTHPLPRLQAWYGEPHARYSYSRIALEPLPWTPGLLELKNQLEEFLAVRFQGVLCNFYRQGANYAAWHSDNEPQLGTNPTIASLSFGARRRFQLRHLKDQEQKEILLKEGSLLVMEGELQQHWKHQLPKALKVKEARINLTFRPVQIKK